MYYVVAREEPLTVGNANSKYEHNERKNQHYLNSDVDLSKENYFFKKAEKSYKSIFNDMEENGLFSTRRIKIKEASTKIGSEIIVAVAGDYFESKEQAIEFFKVANEALNEFFTVRLPDGTTIKGEDLCMSSVVHCDEKSFGLHYVAATCVPKELKKKRTNKEMAAGSEPVSKGYYCQLSHSNFWNSDKDENGKLYYSYSKLNDVIADAYKKAGYKDIERGKRGSTAKHLHPNEYKALMRELQAEVSATAPIVTTKKIAGKIVLDEVEYKRLQEWHDRIKTQYAIIQKSQDSIDEQIKEISQERYDIKKRELLAEKATQENKDALENYNQAMNELREKDAELVRKEATIKEQKEMLSFWQELCEFVLRSIGKIMDSVKELLYGNPDKERQKNVYSVMQNLYDEVRKTIENTVFLPCESR